MSATVAERLGAYVASLRTRDLSQEVLTKAAVCLVDAIGLGVAARHEPSTRAYLRTVQTVPDPVPDQAGSGEDGAGTGGGEGSGPVTARLWASSKRTLLSEAAAANAFAVHARFQDDCDMASWSHPGSLVIPAAVTVADATGASLDQVLRGIVAGYTAINWLGADGVYGHAMVERGFRTSPVLGPVGAAAAASVVLGLGPEQAAQALSSAAAVAGGVIDTVRTGSSDFRWQNASAAWQGLRAALLAREGLDGSPPVFESPAGFLSGFAGLAQPIEVPGEPSPEAILTTWAKPFPALGDNVAVIAAALAVHQQGPVDPDQVTRIRVHQNAQFASYPGTSYRGPFTRPVQAIASTAYGVASTLVHGVLRYTRYLNALNDPAVEALVARTQIVPEADYGFLDGLVSVEFSAGQTRTGAAGDLPRTTFFRDRTAAVAAMEDLFAETGLDAGASRTAADALFAQVSYGQAAGWNTRTFLDAFLIPVRSDLTEAGV
ncbi:MAG TPA: MmgE/PrpD family protein [Trebonia sp.]|jgi:2-methylcitrate dehydratase PrpD|nr:MmgE/PrpD family protein [Trebonia sp.]